MTASKVVLRKSTKVRHVDSEGTEQTNHDIQACRSHDSILNILWMIPVLTGQCTPGSVHISAGHLRFTRHERSTPMSDNRSPKK